MKNNNNNNDSKEQQLQQQQNQAIGTEFSKEMTKNQKKNKK
ncbi:MAG: hypothetical protein ACQEWV_00975 [Bacillota bacterium]